MLNTNDIFELLERIAIDIKTIESKINEIRKILDYFGLEIIKNENSEKTIRQKRKD